MDASLYDEFGNYIGPELDGSSSSEEEEDVQDVWGAQQQQEPEQRPDREEVDQQQQEVLSNQPQQVVMYHDKNYFPDASDVYPGAETMVQDEDTQPLETPIIAPVKEKCFEMVERSVPETTFDFRFLTALMDTPSLVRNVALVGHLHHGKTLLMDMLVRETHDREWNAGREERYTDTRLDEQERGISLKAVSMSLVLQDLRSKSYLINVMDCPGHVNFCDEQAAALRLADGAVVVVDAVEGMMMQTERALKQAVVENVPVVLLINKIDRLMLELKLPPGDAYHKLVHTIEEVNSVLEASGYAKRLSPSDGDVIFASALYSWSFTVFSFANIYLDRQQQMSRSKKKISTRQFAEKLWGENYLDERGRFVKSGEKRTFVQFILEPLYKVYSHVIGADPKELAPMLAELGVFLKKRELLLDPKLLLRLVLDRFFGSSSGLVDSLVTHFPSPIGGARAKVERSYSGDLSTEVGEAMLKCNADGPTMVNVTKLIPRSDGTVFDAFGRILSGTIRVGDRVRVLREGFSLDDDEDMSVKEITKIWVYEARYRIEVNRVCAGNWALFEGLDTAISKTATLTSMEETTVADACVFSPLRFDSLSCVKVAIEPINPSELPKMLDGLRKISKSYPLAHTKVEESGEHIIVGTGELYLDCILHDLRRMYSHIEIKVADPVACFSETVVDTSSIKCFAETPNKQSKLTMIAEPLEQGLAADIEAGNLSLSWDKKRFATFLEEKYEYDVLAARTVWAFGPDSDGPNMLMDDTLESDVDKKLLYSVKGSVVQGFQWATREGPLCDEPIRNVKFKMLDATIASQPIQRGGGQIIPTARRVVYSAFLLATPRLMEPIYSVQIQTPADCIAAIYKVLARRRGHVTKEAPKPGSPLFDVLAYVPVLDSFGFETDLRTHTQGQAFCLSVFDHWANVPGDPLDKSVVLHPLEPSPPNALARELMLKTRRRKGLSEDVSINKFFDDPMLLALARQDAELSAMQER